MKPASTHSNPGQLVQKATLHLQISGRLRRVELISGSNEGSWQVVLDGNTLRVNAQLLQPGVMSLLIQGQTYRCLFDKSPTGEGITVNGENFAFESYDPRSLRAQRQNQSTGGGEQIIKAPMPGRIVRILVERGQEVAARQPILAIEAMKMQNELKALRAGVVKEIRVEAGQTVAAAEILAVLS